MFEVIGCKLHEILAQFFSEEIFNYMLLFSLCPKFGALIRSRKILAGGFNKYFPPNSLIISTVNKCQESIPISGNSSTRKRLVFPNKQRILASMFAVMALALSTEPVAKQLVLNQFWQNKKQQIQQSWIGLKIRFEHCLVKRKWRIFIETAETKLNVPSRQLSQHARDFL